MSTFKLAVLAGDGIGPEVMRQAQRVLAQVADLDGHTIQITEALIGGAAFDQYQAHFPEPTKTLCQNSDAILFGSVGGPVTAAQEPKWQHCETNSILALRKTFALYANFRTAKVYPELGAICPLKDHLIASGIDVLIIRELQGDIYFGEHRKWQDNKKRHASDVALYSEQQIARIARQGFLSARARRGHLTSVDKANVLATSQLWREVVTEMASQFPDVKLSHMLVDNCAMQLIRAPAQFDVIVTANLFGDILSDAAAVLPGSLGLLPSASLNEQGFGLFEPAGGSAPDIAGKNIANPIAQILSVALLFRYSLHAEHSAARIERAVAETLTAGFRTADIATKNETAIGTREMTDQILRRLNA